MQDETIADPEEGSGGRRVASRAEQPDITRRLLLARILIDEANRLVGEHRDVLEPSLRPTEKVVGELPDGTVMGSVSRTKAASTAKVTDEKALLAWVRENRPGEIQESVNPAFVTALKTQCKRDGHAWDTVTGEVIPGIDKVDGASSFRVTVDDDARPVVLARLSELVAGGMLSLPVADERGAA